MPLSDMENCAIGVLCGVSDTTLLQSTNYWKTASQQKLPFSINPLVVYRGCKRQAAHNSKTVREPSL